MTKLLTCLPLSGNSSIHTVGGGTGTLRPQ